MGMVRVYAVFSTDIEGRSSTGLCAVCLDKEQAEIIRKNDLSGYGVVRERMAIKRVITLAEGPITQFVLVDDEFEDWVEGDVYLPKLKKREKRRILSKLNQDELETLKRLGVKGLDID